MKIKHLITAASFALAANAGAANIIINGDFESSLTGFHNYGLGSELGTLNYGPTSYGALLPDNWNRGPTETRIWTVTDQGRGDLIPGLYSMRLDAANAGNPNGGPETLRQGGLNMTVVQYTFTSDLWGQSGTGATLLVELIGTGANLGNDITIGTFNDTTDGSIQLVSHEFTPSVAGEYEIRLSAPNGDGNHVFVDNISIEEVPEPSSTALLGLGGLALILRRRK